jgi:hypothetical protein
MITASAAAVGCGFRQQCLHNAGFVDIFKAVKQTEDEAALQLLPQVRIYLFNRACKCREL